MEVSPERLRHLTLFGTRVIEMPESRVWSMLYSASAGLVLCNVFGLPFVLPKARRFLGAPFLPTQTRTVDALFDRILLNPPSNTGCKIGSKPKKVLLDVGSGDGRIVFGAAKRGFRAVGVELNPYLWAWSKVRERWCLSAEERRFCELRLGNVWTKIEKKDWNQVDVVTVYGRPGDHLMQLLGRKMEEELKKDALVCSNMFEVPGWEKKLVRDTDGIKVYDMKYT